MNPIVAQIAAMSPEQLTELLRGLSAAFSARADKVYEINPEQHGVLAQPYSDLSDLLEEASMVFAAGKLDILPSSEASDVFTQKADDNAGLISATTPSPLGTPAPRRPGSPWGNR